MANLKDLTEEELNNPTLTTTAQSGVVGGGASTPASSQAEGTSFVNLKKYLDANNGLGGNVAGAVTADSTKAIGSAAEKINDYSVANSADKVDKTDTNALDTYKNQIAADPTKVDAAGYKAAQAKAYGGPTDATSATGFTDASKQYGNAKDTYDNLSSDDWNARSSAVSDTFKKDNNQYTKGMGLLDTFIVQGDEGGKKAMGQYKTDNASTFAPEGKDKLSLARAGVQSGFDTAKGAFDTAKTGAAQAITDKRKVIDEGLKDKQYAKSDEQRLDAERQMAQKYKDVGMEVPKSFNGFYTASDNSNYISPEDLAALNSLSGLDGADARTSTEGEAKIDWNSLLADIQERKSKPASGDSIADAPPPPKPVTNSDGGSLNIPLPIMSDAGDLPASAPTGNNGPVTPNINGSLNIPLPVFSKEEALKKKAGSGGGNSNISGNRSNAKTIQR